jgi:hypothetical protein
MTRSKTDPTDPTESEQALAEGTVETSSVVTPVAASDEDPTRTEPYPGAGFFHGGRYSPIVAAMARRLEAEGCTDSRPLGADWTNAHRDAFAAWQHKLRPKEGGDVSGIPDEVAWNRLRVPRVSPLPRES